MRYARPTSIVESAALAAEGSERISWARSNMPLLAALREESCTRASAGRAAARHVPPRRAQDRRAGRDPQRWRSGDRPHREPGDHGRRRGGRAGRRRRRGVRGRADIGPTISAHVERRARPSEPDLLLDNGADLIAGRSTGRAPRDGGDRGDHLGRPPPAGGARRTGPVPGGRHQRQPAQAGDRERAGGRAERGRWLLPGHQPFVAGDDVRGRRLRLVRAEHREDVPGAGRDRARGRGEPGPGARGRLRRDAGARVSSRRRAGRTRSSRWPGRPGIRRRAAAAASGRRARRQHGPLRAEIDGPPCGRRGSSASRRVAAQVVEYQLADGRRVHLLGRGEMLNLTGATGTRSR